MRISRITRVVSAGIAFVATLALSAVAAAQGEAPVPTCALASADEVSTVLGSQIALNENSGGYYCSLGGDSALTISLLPETELEPMKADFSGGGARTSPSPAIQTGTRTPAATSSWPRTGPSCS
jgi:hypothetical protein